MSDLFDKLQAPTQDHGGKARARLEQLRERWGFSHTSTERMGTAIIRDPFGGGYERWTKISGSGEKAIYEFSEYVKPSPEGAQSGASENHQG